MHVDVCSETSRDAGSIPAASTRANLREIASWPFSLIYAKFLAFLHLNASNEVHRDGQLNADVGLPDGSLVPAVSGLRL